MAQFRSIAFLLATYGVASVLSNQFSNLGNLANLDFTNLGNTGNSHSQNKGGSHSGSTFNVDAMMQEIMSDLDGVLDGASKFTQLEREGSRVFGVSDNSIRHDQAEVNSRSLVSGAQNNNEFVDIQAARDSALNSESQARKIVNSAGTNADAAFSANGAPQTQEVAEVAARVAVQAVQDHTCVFTNANTQPCTSKFREPTGRCSHVEEGRRTWGMAGTPFARLLPNKYEDGIATTRRTEFQSGRPLKSARKISETVTNTNILLHRDFSAQLMQWGQFISHEFTLIGELEGNVECCPDKVFAAEHPNSVATPERLETIREQISSLRGHICIAIENFNDTKFGDHVCIQQTRSTIAPNHRCTPGPRQQANTITHFFDASAVYGSSQSEADALRSHRDGKMKVQLVNGHTLPPPNNDNCPASATARCPFLAGDNRVNTTPNLISTHAMFLVLHNKFADELQGINPHWDDERLYQETRRIVAGIQSAIHYHEYLPIVLGEEMFTKWVGGYRGYDSEVDPSILNEMAGAAMRYGHSIIDGIFFSVNDEGNSDLQPLVPNFFNHDLVYDLGATQLLRGLQIIAPWKTDNHFPTEMRDALFGKNNDIVSLNINRGRDHGFASYLDYRRHYGQSVPTSWEALKQTHSDVVVASLRQVYATVEDIELYIGGVTENPVRTGVVGETFANIIGDGFARVRDGDSFYYASQENGLTLDQVNALEHFPLAQLLCVGGGLSSTSRNAFFQPNSPESTNVQCSSFSKLDLSLWKEEPVVEEVCEWRVVEVSKCCNGRKTVTRECVGESRTCKCNGPKTKNKSCQQCRSGDWGCFLEQIQCGNLGSGGWGSGWQRYVPCFAWENNRLVTC